MKMNLKKHEQERIIANSSVRQETSNLLKEQVGIYTVSDLMSIFGVTRRTISNWQASGKLSYVKVGNLLYVTKQQLDDFIQENSVVGFKRYGRARS